MRSTNPSSKTHNPLAEIYAFSAKERDTETGLSYFGARYYSSDLSIWLAVDPMSDKYPHQSNYVYCSDNPIMVIDPNGEFDTRTEARQYRKEHHTGGTIRRNKKYDNFSGKYSIDNKQTNLSYTKPKNQDSETIGLIYGQDNEGVACSPLIIDKKVPDNDNKVMVATITLCGGLLADDATGIGVVDDPAIPVVIAAGVITTGCLMLFAHKIKKQSKGRSKKDRHEAQYTHGGKIRPENPNKRKGADNRRNKGRIID